MSFTHLRRALLGSLLIAPLVALAQAQPDCATGVCPSLRLSSYTLSGADHSLFSDASTYYQVVSFFGSTAEAGAMVSQVVSAKTGNQNFTVYSPLGDLAVTSTPFDGVSSTVEVTNNGGGGQFTIGYDTPVGQNFGESWIKPGLRNNFHTLDFQIGGSGIFGPSPLNVYWLQVVLPGDWSGAGVGSGLHEVTSTLPAGYGVINDFTYDAVSGSTFLWINRNGWDGQSPALEFSLYGVAAVPEPSRMALFLFGAFAVGAALRQRRPAIKGPGRS